MKFLTDTLTFDASSLGATLGDTAAYTLKVSVIDGTELSSYDGVIYYYSAYQVIDYSHMIRNIRDLGNGTVIGRVLVELVSAATNSTVEDEDIILCERTFGIPDGLTSADYIPSDGKYITHILPNCVERPMVANGQPIPVMFWLDETADFTGATITSDTGDEYELEDDYPFQELVLSFTGGSDGVTIESETGGVEIEHHIAAAPCSASHMLVWYDNRGFFQSRPFYGNETVNVEHHDITDIDGRETRIENKVSRSWSLQSAWVHHQNTYESLLVSKYVMLYDCVSGEYVKVLVSDTDFNYTKSKDPFRFNVNLKYDRTYYSR